MPWLRVDCNIEDDEFIITALTGDEFKAWTLFNSRVKSKGRRGSVAKAEISTLARNWNLPVEAVSSMLKKAWEFPSGSTGKAGHRIYESGGRWYIRNWDRYQEDHKKKADDDPENEIPENEINPPISFGDTISPSGENSPMGENSPQGGQKLLHYTTLPHTTQPHTTEKQELVNNVPSARQGSTEPEPEEPPEKHIARQKAKTIRELREFEYLISLYPEELELLRADIGRRITEENRGRVNKFIWTPTCGSTESDLKKLVYAVPKETKLAVLGHLMNYDKGRQNWANCVTIGIMLTVRQSETTRVSEPYAYTLSLLQTPNTIVSAIADGKLQNLKI